MELVIRPLEGHAELAQAEALQQAVWGGPPLVPSATMRAVLEVGGSVLGAWLGGELAGFCFGFPGWRQRQPVPPGLEEPAGGAAAAAGPPAGPPPVPGEPGRREPVFHSDLLAVRPELRDRGIGRRLKLAQREWALRQGLHLITWTYDPLQARNGYLNLTRLGGVARRYVREFYGVLDDELNRGLPADRVVIEWYLTSRRVARRAGAGEGPGDSGRSGLAVPAGAPGPGAGAETAAAGDAPGSAPEGSRAPDPVPGPPAPGPAELPVLNRVRDDGGLPVPLDWQAPGGEPEVAVLIPARFAEWRQNRFQWGLEWRFHLRHVLEAALGAGYLLDRCLPGPGGATVTYVLARRASP
ncbi:GNAT family N-acetyltransferase [Thermaerobacter litoralis]